MICTKEFISRQKLRKPLGYCNTEKAQKRRAKQARAFSAPHNMQRKRGADAAQIRRRKGALSNYANEFEAQIRRAFLASCTAIQQRSWGAFAAQIRPSCSADQPQLQRR